MTSTVTTRVRIKPSWWGASRSFQFQMSPMPRRIRWAGEGNRVASYLHRFDAWGGAVANLPIEPRDVFHLELDMDEPPDSIEAELIPEARPLAPARPRPWRKIHDVRIPPLTGHAAGDRVIELERRSLLPHRELALGPPGLAADVRAARLFWHVDARLHPSILLQRDPRGRDRIDAEVAFRLRSLYELHGFLQARFEQRCRGGVPAPPLESLLAEARHVSGYLVRAFDDWYLRAPDLPDGPDPVAPGSVAPPRRSARETGLDRAFARFASSRLRLHQVGDRPDVTLTDGAPDGPGIFLWVEVALLAVEFGIDADVWLDLLPGLVQAEELYLRIYGAGLGDPIPIRALTARHAGDGPPRPGPEVVDELPAPASGTVDELLHRHTEFLRTRVRGRANLAGIDRSGGVGPGNAIHPATPH